MGRVERGEPRVARGAVEAHHGRYDGLHVLHCFQRLLAERRVDLGSADGHEGLLDECSSRG